MKRRRLLAHRARNAVLCGAVGFVALQAALTCALDRWAVVLRDPPYGFKSAALRRRLRPTDPAVPRPELVVMVGSSRVSDGLRGALVEDELSRARGRPVILYNLGVRGDGPLNELLNVERLVDEGIRPTLLLVEVLPILLCEEEESHLDHVAAERMSEHDLRVLSVHGMPTGRLGRYSWKCWGLPWSAHRVEMLSVLFPEFLPKDERQDHDRECDRSGWRAEPLFAGSPAHRAKAWADAHGSHMGVLCHFRLGNSFLPAFAALLGRCRAEGIQAALVLMPEASTFRALYGPGVWPQIEGFVTGLSTAYGVSVINARDWVPDEQFWDGHHLLPQGGTTFATRLGREAVLPLLRRGWSPEQPGMPHPPQVRAAPVTSRPVRPVKGS